MWLRLCLSVVLTGCFSPQAPAGAPCPDGNCPDGQRCVAQVCTIDGVDSDGPVDPPGDSTIATDGPPIDAPPQIGDWNLIATNDTGSLLGGIARTTPIASTTTGSAIIVAIETDQNPVVTVNDSVGNTYTPITGSRATSAARQFGVELWMANDASGGATSVTATTSAGQEIYAVVVWEVAGLAKSNPIDDVAVLNDAGPAAKPVGAQVSITQTGGFAIAIAIVQSSVENLVLPTDFVNDHSTLFNGWAHIQPNKPPGAYSAQWENQSSNDVFCASSVAFKLEPN
jgi:hypothetical protein